MKATIIVALLCSSLVLGLSGCGGDAGPEELVSAGVALVDQGQAEEAMGPFDEAIRVDSRYAGGL